MATNKKLKALWAKLWAFVKKNWEKIAVFIIEQVLPPLIESYAVTKAKVTEKGKGNGRSTGTT